ncbi:pyrimidine 5-nucleotidase [Ramaria rubella]|nr:pyrimidine 5-nucleotidase [Ramaria rubella]
MIVVDADMNEDQYHVWLDIDNTLYTSNAKISELMTQRIHCRVLPAFTKYHSIDNSDNCFPAYFVTDLGLTEPEASTLHHDYYTKYGLALRGLVRHHGADGLDFDKKCDQSLPLEELLCADLKVRKLLKDIDRRKARVWALTNAYITHATRVLRILKLDDLVEDIVFCDYAVSDFSCKPEAEYYLQALRKAKVSDPSICHFVDDNLQNVRAAKKLGWGSCIYYREKRAIHGDVEETNDVEGVDATIESLEELRILWKHIFKV